MNYIVTKSLKSKGLAALLAFVPFGLFYSSIWGGVVMYFVVPPLTIYEIADGGITLVMLTILIPLYFLTCLAWALISVSDYNEAIMLSIRRENENNNIQGHSFQPQIEQSPADEIGNKKSEIYKNLETVKSLYDNTVIDEAEYIRQKESLLKKLDILSYNESSSQTPAIVENVRYDPNQKSNYLIWILIVLFISSAVFWYNSNEILSSSLFDVHAKDKAAIKEQIEKTYFGISYGAYTAQTIQGEGIDNLPFYNQNLRDLITMGLTPMANFMGIKFLFEVKNIDVYEFKNDNTAEVKYDLLVHNDDGIDSGEIDMEVRKIGGYWKLDGEKAFGKQQEHIEKKKSDNSVNNVPKASDNYIEKSLLESNDSVLKVIQFSENEEGPFKDETDDRYFIFDGKKIYMILNGKIEKVLHRTNDYMDDEYSTTETKEGYTLSEFGTITVIKPNGEKVTYKTESVSISEVYLEDQYIR